MTKFEPETDYTVLAIIALVIGFGILALQIVDSLTH